jgi:hypothetical protein
MKKRESKISLDFPFKEMDMFIGDILFIDTDRVAEPKLFFSAPAPTFKKFRLRSRLRLRLEL